jgi:hypothetical protein
VQVACFSIDSVIVLMIESMLETMPYFSSATLAFLRELATDQTGVQVWLQGLIVASYV